MNAAWSPQQREWLQALGHDVLVMATAAIEAPPATAESAAAGGQPLPAPPRETATATAAADSALRRALQRAAGRRDLGALDWLPDPAALRGNAAAKRALWPRLRTLRKPFGDA